MQDNNYILILAGGTGSRLWPVSHRAKPKQFIDFFGTGRTLLQQTYDRMAKLVDPSHIYVSTHVDYLPIVHEQLPEVDDVHILEEPVGRGTLAAVAWGTVVIAKFSLESNVYVTPADQLIFDEASYQDDVRKALDFASRHQTLLVAGIPPTRPETGYGYIQMNDEKQVEKDIFEVKSFTEKPDSHFAEIFLQEGNFLWNTGQLAFNVEVMLNNIYSLVPEYRLEIPRMMAEAETETPRTVPEFFSSVPNLNIDLSVLERCNEVVVQKGHFGWMDIGTWNSLYESAAPDGEGNVLLDTKAFLYECKDNVICLPNGRKAVIKGLKDYVVAEDEEVLMICPRRDVTTMRKMYTDATFS